MWAKQLLTYELIWAHQTLFREEKWAIIIVFDSHSLTRSTMENEINHAKRH